MTNAGRGGLKSSGHETKTFSTKNNMKLLIVSLLKSRRNVVKFSSIHHIYAPKSIYCILTSFRPSTPT
jgi:hypothetical protein